MLKIRCGLRNGREFKSFAVTINTEEAEVDDLKDAIHAKYFTASAPVSAVHLTLVRVYQAGAKSGGLTQDELESWPDCLRVETYGENPENAEERQSNPPSTVPTIVKDPDTYSVTQQLFELDSDYLAESGLPSATLVLFCRKVFHEQFNFLRQQVMLNSRFGWILGPPGTGKSTTSLAFVSVMAREFPDWTITWIHLRRADAPKCVRFSKMQKWSFVIKQTDVPNLDVFLDQVEGNHIVFLDGYVSTEPLHVSAKICCNAWRESLLEERRLVVVSSMSSRGKTNPEDDALNLVEEFFVFSWELDEYRAAAMYPKFMETVTNSLDSMDVLDTDPTELPLSDENQVISKYFYAGGSSRFMFRYNTAKVMGLIQGSVKSVSNLNAYASGAIGDMSDDVVNRSFSCYPRKSSEQSAIVSGQPGIVRQTVIVSKYAARLLSISGGPGLILSLASATDHNEIQL
ncbi:hypothetical protein HDU81_004104 [Chytriomyces hyalinus]|nr:hypothetical protein HDU81_004104 [Chytriomyces hyalinus]